MVHRRSGEKATRRCTVCWWHALLQLTRPVGSRREGTDLTQVSRVEQAAGSGGLSRFGSAVGWISHSEMDEFCQCRWSSQSIYEKCFRHWRDLRGVHQEQKFQSWSSLPPDNWSRAQGQSGPLGKDGRSASSRWQSIRTVQSGQGARRFVARVWDGRLSSHSADAVLCAGNHQLADIAFRLSAWDHHGIYLMPFAHA